ncbi:MAG: carboxypeptidase-like regulatory domain-containing protein [Rhizomicrobium sp.]
MKSHLIRAALACAVLAFASQPVMAAEGGTSLCPPPHVCLGGVGVMVTTKKGQVVARARTDDDGQVSFKGLPAGDYLIVIDGLSLVSATERAAPTPPKKESGGVSVGIGGLFGGGGRSGHEGHDSHGGGGGVGVGLNIPLGSGDQGSGPQDNPITAINITLPGEPPRLVNDGNTANWGTGTSTFLEVPYCPDAAKRGLNIGATIKQNPGWLMVTIFDRWGNM